MCNLRPHEGRVPRADASTAARCRRALPCALQGDSGTDAFRCVEMREGAPWLWQADAYGVAACAHSLLHGRYLDVERVRDSGTGVREGRQGGLVSGGGWCRGVHGAHSARVPHYSPPSCLWALRSVPCASPLAPLAPLMPGSSAGAVSLRPVQPLKRQWACNLWDAFFHRLLNCAGAAPAGIP